MVIMIIDKLYERVKERGVVCVGLDTDYSYLPQSLQIASKILGMQFLTLIKIIDATIDVAACFKVQIKAYYEAMA